MTHVSGLRFERMICKRHWRGPRPGLVRELQRNQSHPRTSYLLRSTMPEVLLRKWQWGSCGVVVLECLTCSPLHDRVSICHSGGIEIDDTRTPQKGASSGGRCGTDPSAR